MRRRSGVRRRWPLASVVVLTMLLLTASCGGDDEEEESADATADYSASGFWLRDSATRICLRWDFDETLPTCSAFADQTSFAGDNFDDIDKLADLLQQGLDAADTDGERLRRIIDQIDTHMTNRGIAAPGDQPNATDLPFSPRFRPTNVPADDWTALRRALLALRALF